LSKNNRNVIRDGVAVPGYIQADPTGLYGSCAFKYRPMLPEETEELEYYRDNLRDKPKELIVKMAAAIADRIVAWSEAYEDGSPVPVGKDTIRRLPHRLFIRLYRIISQQEASDKNPDDQLGSDEPVSLRELEGN